ncbi:hypothetical protein B0H14DRAFT_2678624 [Mycena olivaceomarginata]|nr:hypothetical protein B0H14DRAFT_2678624 [Mycena olivaceomarginata]
MIRGHGLELSFAWKRALFSPECVPSASSLRGAAVLLAFRCVCIFASHPFLRSRESSSHCVGGLRLPTRPAIPHREHFDCSGASSLSFVHNASLTAILHARTPSASQESRGRERAIATIFSSPAVRTAELCLLGRPRCLLPAVHARLAGA